MAKVAIEIILTFALGFLFIGIFELIKNWKKITGKKIKPTYSIDEVRKLISEIKDMKEIAELDRILTEERERYPIKEYVTLKELCINRWMQLRSEVHPKIIVQVVDVPGTPIIECNTCGEKNPAHHEKCKKCNCQL